MWLQEIFNQVFDSASNRLKVLTQAPDLEDKIDDLNNKITALDAAIDSIKDTDGIKKITDTVNVQLSGSIVAEQKTNADAAANVITFSANISAVEIYHESATWQDFIVNGITLKIPSGGYRTPIAGTVAKTVTIPAGVNCIVGRLV